MGASRKGINNVDNDESEEAVKAKLASAGRRPTEKEVEEHMNTHLPYRSWCPHCVRGKARGTMHVAVKDKEGNEIPVVGIDYMFFVKEGENEEENGMPTIVIKDSKSKVSWARVLKRKGVEVYSVKVLSKFLSLMGYKRIIMRSDNEPAILALKEELKKNTEVEIVPEESPAYESKSNGEIEREIQAVQEQFRVMKDGLESRLGKRIPRGHVMIPWLVAHASDAMVRYKVGDDGKTAHERWKGRAFKRVTPEIGEVIHFLRAGTRGKDKDEVRWVEGCFLGIRHESGEIIVGNSEGVVKARDFRRMGSNDERWSFEKINMIRGTPWKPNPEVEDANIYCNVKLPNNSNPVDPVISGSSNDFKMRRVRISPEDVKKRGLLINCPGCRAIRDGKPSENHSEECRTSVEIMMKKRRKPQDREEEKSRGRGDSKERNETHERRRR